MDKIDAMLITLLQENARAPLKVLASKVFLSAPAVSSRIDKLEKQGIILGYNTDKSWGIILPHLSIWNCLLTRKRNFILSLTAVRMYWNVTV